MFSTLDLASGYWQVPLSPGVREKSAFATHSGLFQFSVMPFGLCNAPATFERLMSQVLRGLQWERCLVYIDDILIFGRLFQEALQNLTVVLNRVSQYGLQLKAAKCNLFCTEVAFLGHVLGREGLSCDPNKLAAVREWVTPTNARGVREFLGFTGYYRRFVKDFATISAPLVSLLIKDARFMWTPECTTTFEHLQDLLVTAPILAFFVRMFPTEWIQMLVDMA